MWTSSDLALLPFSLLDLLGSNFFDGCLFDFNIGVRTWSLNIYFLFSFASSSVLILLKFDILCHLVFGVRQNYS